MNDYLMLMHDDAVDRAAADDPQAWSRYLAALRASGNFEGGSAIGPGQSFRRGQATRAASGGITGFIRLRANTLADAARWIEDNPVHQAGGTVEVRELIRD